MLAAAEANEIEEQLTLLLLHYEENTLLQKVASAGQFWQDLSTCEPVILRTHIGSRYDFHVQ